MENIIKLENLVGKRYKNLDLLKHDIETITNKKIEVITESDSDRFDDMDFMIDFYFENDESNVYTAFYLKDNSGNYYITEVA